MADKLIDFQKNSTNVRINRIKRAVTHSLFSLSWMINNSWVQNFIRTNYFVPRSYRLSNEENTFLRAAESFRINVNDQNIVCWKWGSGPAIVFVHGWNGRGIQFQNFIRAALVRGYSAITFDGPGHGDSDGKSSSYFEMTDALRAVLRHYSENAIIAVIGHSFGAAAIINALHKEGARIPSVLLAPALDIKEMLDTVFALHGVPLHIFNHLIKTYEQRFGYDLNLDNPKNLLQEYSLQAMIIHDKQDSVTPFEDSKKVTEKFPLIRLFATNGLGHKKIIYDQRIIGETFDYINSPNS